MISLIAGKYKGKKLYHFSNIYVRPTQAKIRKSIFQIFEPYKILEKNTALFPNEKIRLHLSDAIQFISRINQERFDIIFADPPYTMKNFQNLKEKVQSCLKPNGIFCMEMQKQDLDESPDRVKYYGNTQVVFWKATA